MGLINILTSGYHRVNRVGGQIAMHSGTIGHIGKFLENPTNNVSEIFSAITSYQTEKDAAQGTSSSNPPAVQDGYGK